MLHLLQNDYLCSRLMMRRERKHRVIIAWVLLFALLPMSIVKATHFHDTEEAVPSHSAVPGHPQSGDSGNTCPICHFFLSPFIEVPTFHFTFCTQLVAVFIARPCTGTKQADKLSLSLRAPPAACLA